MILKQEASLLLALEGQAEEIMKLIMDLSGEQIKRDAKILTSMQGIGDKTVFNFLIEVGGDIKAFEHDRKLIAAAGLDPTTHESGKYKGQSTISKRGNRHLRRVIWLMTTKVIIANQVFRTYYFKRRKEGLIYKKAVLATAHKLVRVMFSMLVNQECFEPERSKINIVDYKGHTLTDTFTGHELARRLERAVRILGTVIDQTERRVLKGEKVPASEKIVSFFEDHTDIIVKGRRETEYGHKVFLSGGTSTMILGCLITRGNPADTDRYQPLLSQHKDWYGRMPRQVTADGGFASKDNLAFAKQQGVKDAVFAKRRGLSILDMAKSNWVYKKLRNFRAGIEAGISTLKWAFGLDRCTWSGWEGFKRYAWSSIVSYNLLVLARTRLASA